MNPPGQLRLAFYGDDFTGSTDALDFLVRAGVPTVLFIAPPTPERLARYPGLRAVGVAGRTRSLAPEPMTAELQAAFAALRALGAPHVHYKVCSTFDSSPTVGSIGRAIEVGAEVFGASFVPLLVAAPALGRYGVFGNLFARMGIGSAGGIYRLDRHPAMSRHPVTPADESDLRRHLARQTAKRVDLFDILQVELGREEARAALDRILADRPDVVLFDALYPRQLALIGELLDAHAAPERPLFSVGSSGIEMALTAHWTAQGSLRPEARRTESGVALPLLVVSGSCSPVTAGQIAWAAAHGYAEVPLDLAALLESGDAAAVAARAAQAALPHLRAGRSVVVHSSRGEVDPRLTGGGNAAGQGANATMAQLIGTALGRIVLEAATCGERPRVLVAGGDTSSAAARAMGIEAVEVVASLAPGMPLCRAHAPGSSVDGLELNFKGGQVGAGDYFDVIARLQVCA